MSQAEFPETKRLLVLGAGLVVRPLVEYFLALPGYHVTVASRTVSKAEALLQGRPHTTAKSLNVHDAEALREAVAQSDLVVSLLPATHHVTVARLCIEMGKLMATTSYVSPAMRALDAPAREAGLMLLNECGLDPGIDHMSAKKIIDEVQGAGGRVVAFSSSCGGLPAPEANDVPWGYKFSWSPRGVLTAAKNPARFLRHGKIVEIPGEKLFRNPSTLIFDGIEYEVYPNRDSLGYIELYGLDGVETMFRGTIRNRTHCELWDYLWRLGMLDESTSHDFDAISPAEFLLRTVPGQANDPARRVAQFLGIPPDHFQIEKMRWAGMFGAEPLGIGKQSPLDMLAHLLEKRLVYKPGERDMIILHHEFEVEYPAEQRRRRITSTLIDYGIPHGDTSMARTVSLPVAIAARLMLEGKIHLPGVHIPVAPEIYNPILEELAGLGIRFEETSTEI
jgi:saccharopine dehydrogenase-like NADP-dependent oxidoreductase